jgi:hypothetical protein
VLVLGARRRRAGVLLLVALAGREGGLGLGLWQTQLVPLVAQVLPMMARHIPWHVLQLLLVQLLFPGLAGWRARLLPPLLLLLDLLLRLLHLLRRLLRCWGSLDAGAAAVGAVQMVGQSKVCDAVCEPAPAAGCLPEQPRTVSVHGHVLLPRQLCSRMGAAIEEGQGTLQARWL